MNQKIEHRGDVLLKKWLDGTITWQEERELEQLAKGDALLADALAGFRAMPEGNHAASVARIKARLQARTEQKRRGLVFYLPRVAAAAIVSALSFGIWFLNQDANPPQTAIQEQQETAPFVEEETELLTEDVSAADTNAAIAMEEPATTPVNPGQPSSPIIKPRVPRTDGVVVEMEATDTNLAIAEAATPMEAEEAKPEIAAKKAEAAPPQTFERAQSAATTRALTAPIARVVTGRVTDTKGTPLIGASIVIPGTNQGTVSDVEGNFKIEVPPGKEQLALNYTGYETKKVNVINNDSINITLEESNQALEEVVVTGLGKTRARKETNNKDTPQVRIRSKLSTTRQPEPRGGFDNFKRYIDKNVRYPKAAQEAGIEGEVVVAFTILPNGQLTDFKIRKSLGYGLEEEAIRLLREGSKWDMRSKGLQRDTASYTIEFKLKK